MRERALPNKSSKDEMMPVHQGRLSRRQVSVGWRRLSMQLIRCRVIRLGLDKRRDSRGETKRLRSQLRMTHREAGPIFPPKMFLLSLAGAVWRQTVHGTRYSIWTTLRTLTTASWTWSSKLFGALTGSNQSWVACFRNRGLLASMARRMLSVTQLRNYSKIFTTWTKSPTQ